MRWTREDVDRLRKLAPRMSARQVGLLLGKSRNAVIGACERRGIALGGVTCAPKKPRPEPRIGLRPVVDKTESRKCDTPPPHEETPEIDGMILVPIWDLRAAHCLWPVGDPMDAEEFRYCGRQRENGSYCADHAALAYWR